MHLLRQSEPICGVDHLCLVLHRLALMFSPNLKICLARHPALQRRKRSVRVVAGEQVLRHHVGHGGAGPPGGGVRQRPRPAGRVHGGAGGDRGRERFVRRPLAAGERSIGGGKERGVGGGVTSDLARP